MASKLLLHLECLLCKDKFSAEAIPSKRYFLETQICRKCYEKGQLESASIWCFGKKPKRNSPGYSEENVACQSLCPDRKICRMFVNRKTQKEK